jgi:hypothetical protein
MKVAAPTSPIINNVALAAFAGVLMPTPCMAGDRPNNDRSMISRKGDPNSPLPFSAARR